MPVENDCRVGLPESFVGLLQTVKPKDLPFWLWGGFLELPYQAYSSDRLDGNSDAAAADFENLYAGFCRGMEKEPRQECIAGTGLVGGRRAIVRLHHHQQGGHVASITCRTVEIFFLDQPSTVYCFGDGAHIIKVDADGEVVSHEVRRDREAKELMDDLMMAGMPLH